MPRCATGETRPASREPAAPHYPTGSTLLAAPTMAKAPAWRCQHLPAVVRPHSHACHALHHLHPCRSPSLAAKNALLPSLLVTGFFRDLRWTTSLAGSPLNPTPPSFGRGTLCRELA